MLEVVLKKEIDCNRYTVLSIICFVIITGGLTAILCKAFGLDLAKILALVFISLLLYNINLTSPKLTRYVAVWVTSGIFLAFYILASWSSDFAYFSSKGLIFTSLILLLGSHLGYWNFKFLQKNGLARKVWKRNHGG